MGQHCSVPRKAATEAPRVVLHVLWDIENLPIRSGAKQADDALAAALEAFHGGLSAWMRGCDAADGALDEAVSRGAATFTYYVAHGSPARPGAPAARALDVLGWRHVDVASAKPDAADRAIERDLDVLLASFDGTRDVRLLVCLISSDRDFARPVRRLAAMRCCSVFLVHSPAVTPTFLRLVPERRRRLFTSLLPPPSEADKRAPPATPAPTKKAPRATPPPAPLPAPKKKLHDDDAFFDARSEPLVDDDDDDRRRPLRVREARGAARAAVSQNWSVASKKVLHLHLTHKADMPCDAAQRPFCLRYVAARLRPHEAGLDCARANCRFSHEPIPAADWDRWWRTVLDGAESPFQAGETPFQAGES
ncbi:hypothetical protein M885DRAFT_570768 [Pelagophyceae sp. CCMP2097]|nr:hypothetical protein M885DRAFT_570768 [Pelagophyceae sp. CCMP2097]